MKSILVVCGDPGGTAAVAPVLKLLQKDFACHVLGYNQAPRVFAAHGITCETLGDANIPPFFERFSPDLLLTGTSMNGADWENDFIEEASKRNVPSLAVLDFWSNYRRRFRDALPNRVAIMDEQAHDEMIAEGFLAESLVITGQPAFDDIVPSSPSRAAFDLPSDAHIVLFVSQAPNPGIDENHPDYPGFSKFTVLPALYRALEKLKKNILLVVRPHPREETEDYAWLPQGGVPIRVIRDGSSRELAECCDLIVGLNSVLLIEACLLKLPVLSLQPGLRGTDRLPANRMGCSRGVFQEDEIESAVADLLFDTPARRQLIERCSAWSLPRDATKKVADLAHRMIASENILA